MDGHRVPKRFKEGFFAREPLPHVAASRLRAPNPPLAGRVSHVRGSPRSLPPKIPSRYSNLCALIRK